MKSIHIANIGGQPLPVLQGITEFPCDTVLLLHSNESLQVAENIKSIFPCDIRLCSIANPNDYFSILQLCENLAKEYPDSQFYANISGGTKIMSLALFTFFKDNHPDNQIFHIDQNGIVHFLTSNQSQLLQNFLPIKSFIDYSGQKIKSMTKFKDIDPELFDCKDVVKKFFEKSDPEYLKLCKLYSDYSRQYKGNDSFELINHQSYSSVKWSKEEDELIFSFYRKFKTEPEEYCFSGKESIGIALEAKWFELEVAEILSKWFKNKELVWSLVVPYKDGQDKNEIDVIVNTGTKLLFVECKTQISDIKDIDKFRNVTKNYGGLGAKSILVTYSKPPIRFFEKCFDNNILLFYFCERNRIVNSTLDLYRFLNDEITKTNTI
jgi:hypothetical protein